MHMQINIYQGQESLSMEMVAIFFMCVQIQLLDNHANKAIALPNSLAFFHEKYFSMKWNDVANRCTFKFGFYQESSQ